MSTNKSILRSTGLIGILTVFSRILGFVRDVFIARIFGTGIAAEAFVVAFRIPNLMRELIGEGAANAVFVPVFCEYLVKDKKELFRVVNILFNIIFFLLCFIIFLGIIFSLPIVKTIAPGFINDNYKLNLTVRLTRLMFPYLLFIGLTAYAMGILNAFKEFALPAFGPALLNLSLIGACLFSAFFAEPIIVLAWGVLIGGVLQLIIQVPSIYKKGFRFRFFEFQFKHPAVIKISKLLIPRFFGSAIYQLNVFMDTVFASLTRIVGEGAVAAIYYANRIIQFPLAVFGISLSVAALPVMSLQVANADIEKLKNTLKFSLNIIFLITIPISMIICIFPYPIIKLLFEHGNFGSYSVAITASALLFYSLGLPFYALVKIMSSAFFSLKDTETPVKTTSFCLLLNILLNYILMHPLKVGGLALASSISSAINFFLLFYILEKRIGKFGRLQIIDSFLRICLATLFMGLTAKIFWHFLRFPLFFRLLFSLTIAIAVFILSGILLKVEALRIFKIKWNLKKR